MKTLKFLFTPRVLVLAGAVIGILGSIVYLSAHRSMTQVEPVISNPLHERVASGESFPQPVSQAQGARKARQTINADSLKQSSWFGIITKKIEAEEYEIVLNTHEQYFSSPNRKQNLLFTYHNNGFLVKPLMTKIPLFTEADRTIKEKDKTYTLLDDWNIGMALEAYGRDNAMIPFEGAPLSVNGRDASAEDDAVRIKYNNSEKGMRQDFVVKNRPAGTGNLKLLLHIDTKLQFNGSGDGIAFANDRNKVEMKYDGMKITDAAGKEVKGDLVKLNDTTAEVCVKDDEAEYPLTIDPLSSTPSWTQTGENTEDHFGFSVATAGDVNGDGYSDVIVGAYGYSSMTGKAYVFYGSASGLSATASWTKTGENTNDYFGISVATAGDVNRDHYSDVIVGAHIYSSGTGKAYVFYGSASGLSATASWTKTGENTSNGFGISVATAGDVNGDGYSDVIVGAESYLTNTGKAYVFYGSASGLSATASWTQTGEGGETLFGASVATAGDVNNDGYSDVIVGAPSYPYDIYILPKGKAYVFYGSVTGLDTTASWTQNGENNGDHFGSSVATAGDVNGDGYSDVIVGAPNYSSQTGKAYVSHGSAAGLSATASWTKTGENTGDYFGNSVATAGDVNDDGYSDVIVGAYFYSSHKGKAYVFYGSATGLSATASWTQTGENVAYGSIFGNSVATAGDVNGDGYSDVIVGAESYLTNTGKAHVFYGSASGLLPVELTSFTAISERLSAALHWKTATEVNNYGFEIERREVGSQQSAISNWKKIGFVEGGGTTNAPKDYSFTDNKVTSGRYAYRLKQIDKDGTFKYSGSAEVEIGIAPREFSLGQNYPNPFNPSTTIEFTVPHDGRVVLKIFNMLGQDVATLFDGEAKAGYYQRVVFDASKLASGVYFSKLEFGGKQLLKKILMMK